jgi:two-component system, NtrC family, nitrogen regulation response regulator NtrX
MATILVVDDEKSIRELIQQILQDEGHQVYVAGNGHSARALYLAHRFDLLLLDIYMPDIDGLSLLKGWNQQGQRTMPVIIMSAYADASYPHKFACLGVADFLNKPIAYKRLVDAVSTQLTAPCDRLIQVSIGQLKHDLGESALVHDLERNLAKCAASRQAVLLTHEQGAPVKACARLIAGNDPFFVIAPQALRDAPRAVLDKANSTVFIAQVSALDATAQRGLEILLDYAPGQGVRVICASEEPLGVCAHAGHFSQQAYATLYNNAVRIPALRERREDIPYLLKQWLPEILKEHEIGPRSLTVEAIRYLQTGFDYEGNEAELRRTLMGLLLLAPLAVLDEVDVRLHLGRTHPVSVQDPMYGDLLGQPMDEAEAGFKRIYLSNLQHRFDGNNTKIAAFCGRHRSTIIAQIQALGLDAKHEEERMTA